MISHEMMSQLRRAKTWVVYLAWQYSRGRYPSQEILLVSPPLKIHSAATRERGASTAQRSFPLSKRLLAMPSHGCLPCVMASLLSGLCFLLIMSQSAATSQPVSLPGCPSSCGNLTIPYPFGIGTSCSRKGFDLACNHSFTPAKTFFRTSTVEVSSISLDSAEATAHYYRGYDCYSKNGTNNDHTLPGAWAGDELPFTFSSTRNKFTVLGCDTYAYITGDDDTGLSGGCATTCNRLDQVANGSCDGIGCCQVSIPKGLKYYTIEVNSFRNHSKVWDFNPCGYAFLVDKDRFTFQSADITKESVYRHEVESVPLVMDWVAGNESCAVVERDSESFACRSNNSYCYNSTRSATGYLCNCSSGYEGNPYLVDGCQDIDECRRPETFPCMGVCSNIPGSYNCDCPKGMYGNARQGCIRENNQDTPVKVILATVFIALFVTILTICLYGFFEKIKRNKLAEKLYQQNGGTILENHLSTHRDIQSRFKIFTNEEMEKASNKFDDQLVLGRGGQGKVYRGTLSDSTCIAIKKSMQINDTMTDDFINEIIILSKINHPNVVKLIGCCLEVEIPYLVYEFVPNGTLFDHIHGPEMTWEKRLRVAAGAAGALAHLHTVGIYHQDVKSTNILLTVDYTAKISDFGLSRLVPADAKALSTLVQGTIGYLDPEFIVSHKLTGKSDVFSFGVVLAELLTGKVPLSYQRREEEWSLAQHFKLSIEENKLFDILDEQLVNVATDVVQAQIMEVTKLADQCLNMKGKDRPDMMEVFLRLEGLWRSGYHQSVKDENSEVRQSMSDNKIREPLVDKGEEGKLLLNSTTSYDGATFDVEAGR